MLTVFVWEALDHSSGNLPASCDAKLPTIEDGMTNSLWIVHGIPSLIGTGVDGVKQ